ALSDVLRMIGRYKPECLPFAKALSAAIGGQVRISKVKDQEKQNNPSSKDWKRGERLKQTKEERSTKQALPAGGDGWGLSDVHKRPPFDATTKTSQVAGVVYGMARSVILSSSPGVIALEE
ncbi:MAG: hypothetical protein KGK00_09330, partial [Paracoccaceae bacterium]|nr:hypothetical protein [Paracoccaceae bacterium]